MEAEVRFDARSAPGQAALQIGFKIAATNQRRNHPGVDDTGSSMQASAPPAQVEVLEYQRGLAPQGRQFSAFHGGAL